MKGSLCHSPPTAKRFSDEDVLITLYCGYGDKSLQVCWILCPFSRVMVAESPLGSKSCIGTRFDPANSASYGTAE